MPTEVQVQCIRRTNSSQGHERIAAIGGVHGGSRWNLSESDAIAELEKPASVRRWNFYTSVNGHTARVVVAVHGTRKYLKTEADGYQPDNLLALPECPAN